MLKIGVIDLSTHYLVKILEQDYRGAEFGRRRNSFTASNKFTLVSTIYPEFMASGGLVVRGEDTNYDYKTLYLVKSGSIKNWLRNLKIAVQEYNNCIIDLDTNNKYCVPTILIGKRKDPIQVKMYKFEMDTFLLILNQKYIGENLFNGESNFKDEYILSSNSFPEHAYSEGRLFVWGTNPKRNNQLVKLVGGKNIRKAIKNTLVAYNSKLGGSDSILLVEEDIPMQVYE